MDEKTMKFSNKIYVLAIVLVLGVLVFLAGQMVYHYKLLERQNANQITVSGQGKIYAKPDIASINLGVTTDGKTVSEVTNKNTEIMNQIIKDLKGLDILEKDIQTTNYSLSPVYDYTKEQGRFFEGYNLLQSVEVTIRDLTKIGDVMSISTKDGANSVGSPQFTIDNPEQLREQARAKAIAQAKANAQNLAQESGIKLGKLINVYENYYPMYSDTLKGMGGGIAESAPAPVIQPGQQEINVTINLTYQIK